MDESAGHVAGRAGRKALTVPFADRVEAGRLLGRAVHARVAGEDVVVVGLPRGGVPVAFEVAAALGAPLDVIVVRKLGVPFQPELAMGAVGERGVRVLNEMVVTDAAVSPQQLAAVERRERDEVERRARSFRLGRPAVPLAGRTVIVVDDGIATGATARAACQVARAQGARRIVLAVPVGPPGTVERLRPDADEVICLETPRGFFAVGQAYEDFRQTTDEQVSESLELAAQAPHTGRRPAPSDDPPPPQDLDVVSGGVRLAGWLAVPPDAQALVIFAGSSGRARHSAGQRQVAALLNAVGLGTLLLDLLSVEEELDRASVLDVAELARRLVDVTVWLRTAADVPAITGYLATGTSSAAALCAAADPAAGVTAVVSVNGRVDLAGATLALVDAPTLLIVAGLDQSLVRCNRAARNLLRGATRLEVLPGAGRPFEDPRALGAIARLAGAWFAAHLAMARSRA